MKKVGLIISCFLLTVLNSHAQEIPYHDDFQQWVGLKLMYSPTKKFTLSGQYVCRTNQFLNSFVGSYYYGQARYAINKHWFPDIQIRVVDSYQGNLYRYELGLSYRCKWHKNILSYRLGYFNERKIFSFTKNLYDIPAESLHYLPNQYMRNRLGVKRDLSKKFTGYASGEVYTQVEHQQLTIKRLAFIGGLDYEYRKNNILNIEYVYQPDYGNGNRVHLQALFVGYEYDIEHHKKGKKHHHKDEKKDRFKDN